VVVNVQEHLAGRFEFGEGPRRHRHEIADASDLEEALPVAVALQDLAA
jgi:hypothetical protein